MLNADYGVYLVVLEEEMLMTIEKLVMKGEG